MIGEIHWFFKINVHDNHSQTWRANRKEKIGNPHNRFEEKNVYTKSLTVGSMEGSQSLFVIGTESSV